MVNYICKACILSITNYQRWSSDEATVPTTIKKKYFVRWLPKCRFGVFLASPKINVAKEKAIKDWCKSVHVHMNDWLHMQDTYLVMYAIELKKLSKSDVGDTCMHSGDAIELNQARTKRWFLSCLLQKKQIRQLIIEESKYVCWKTNGKANQEDEVGAAHLCWPFRQELASISKDRC